MSKRLWITIDTEMDADPHWIKAWPPEYSSIIDGIPNILRPIWNKYNVTPIYFLSPEVLYSDKCCDVLKREIENGAIIGAHLHPEYIEPCSDIKQGSSSKFPCLDYSKEVEREKIKNLLDLIEEKLGIRPKWYRAARFGADEDTFDILHNLGVKNDSSVTPGIDWSKQGGPNHSMQSPSVRYINGIKEYPVTIKGKRWGIIGRLLPNNWLLYRWLRPTNMTYLELKSIIKQNKNEDMVMMFHSMEIMISKSPYVRNKSMQHYYLWRLEKTIAFAYKCGYEMRTNFVI